jgi:hypothetical protein
MKTAVRRLFASAIAAAIVVASPMPAAADEDALSAAKGLYQRGVAKFETADYEGAIALWADAYGMVPTTPENLEVKVLLLYNLATAQERAYEVSGDLTHLRQALALLDGFAAVVPALYGESEEGAAELKNVAARRAVIVATLAAAEAKDAPPADDSALRRAKKLTIAGAATLGVGGAALGLMTAGLVIGARANDVSGLDPNDVEGRRERFERGRMGDKLALIGGIAAALPVALGATLLALGLKKTRQASASAVAPWIGPGWAGISASGRF